MWRYAPQRSKFFQIPRFFRRWRNGQRRLER
jgi:hypothetical protein